jgi:hypothetical protein
MYEVDDLLILLILMMITRNMKKQKHDLGMRKYFQLYNYPSNVEAIIATYHLQGKASIW